MEFRKCISTLAATQEKRELVSIYYGFLENFEGTLEMEK
jgi:hypothetical protein